MVQPVKGAITLITLYTARYLVNFPLLINSLILKYIIIIYCNYKFSIKCSAVKSTRWKYKAAKNENAQKALLSRCSSTIVNF